MAMLILGFLMIRSLTVYEIKTTLERKISPFYAASFGSIQNAIKNLLAAGQINYSEKVENGRNKKEYFITEVGQMAFLAWMKTEIPITKFNNEALVRVFFLGFLEKEEQLRLLDRYIEGLTAEYEQMLNYQKTVKISPTLQNKQEIVKFQLASLDYGIRELAFELSWYQELAKNIREDKINYGIHPL